MQKKGAYYPRINISITDHSKKRWHTPKGAVVAKNGTGKVKRGVMRTERLDEKNSRDDTRTHLKAQIPLEPLIKLEKKGGVEGPSQGKRRASWQSFTI